tara:strand:- start:2331 stop:3518 length:1188 start_codon:yes stop_codon:yes gene_type:complete
MSKKDLMSAVARKRRQDPKVERKGKAKFVPTFKEEISDEELKKAKELLTGPVREPRPGSPSVKTYLKMLKGLQAHNDRHKGPVLVKDEYIIEKNEPTNPKLWTQAKSLAKKKFDVYPSAYANLWASKWYKKRGGGWKTLTEEKGSTIMNDTPRSTRLTRALKAPNKLPSETIRSQAVDEVEKARKARTKKDAKPVVNRFNFTGKPVKPVTEKNEPTNSKWPITMKTTKDLFLEQLDIAQYGYILEKDDDKDHEYEMARSQLKTSAIAIKRLMEKLGQDEGNLQAWIQSKLTKASDYIDSVADYMDAKDPVVKEAVELSNQVKELFEFDEVEQVIEDEEVEVQYIVAKEGHKLDGEIIESYEVKSNGRVKVKTASGTGYLKEEDVITLSYDQRNNL